MPAVGRGAVGAGACVFEDGCPQARTTPNPTPHTPRFKFFVVKKLVTEVQEASVRPPSTMIVWPVMCRAASLHRNDTT